MGNIPFLLLGVWAVSWVCSYLVSVAIVTNPKHKNGAKLLDGPTGTILTLLTQWLLPMVGLVLGRWEIIVMSFVLANGVEFVIVEVSR